MSAETDFRAALLAHPPLAALLGDRIAANAISAKQPAPYVVFNSSHEPQYGLDGTKHLDRVTFEVQCWATSQAAADAVADAVEAALAPAGGTLLSRSTAYDGELAMDAAVLTVEWWD
ncbi:tail completion protein gp17 [Eleftheria terrae]|uniref:tail completion protein gp17 n=1 Tax=Eleftheria terrae TaxID=1597781 RepID=UPI00263A80CF|nr:DUF3168 domain-containing protein [Eleftheria terrae]WKB52310.1 DUF3168 domain-containing protein [Eleftheria terrae]